MDGTGEAWVPETDTFVLFFDLGVDLKNGLGTLTAVETVGKGIGGASARLLLVFGHLAFISLLVVAGCPLCRAVCAGCMLRRMRK